MLILLSPSTGLVGNLYKLFGGDAPDLIGSAGWFSSIYVWSDVWQHVGWDSIIYIAALSTVDPSLYEAATVDGASRWHKIRYIDIPMLMPTAITLLILRVGGLLGVGFEKVYLMQKRPEHYRERNFVHVHLQNRPAEQPVQLLLGRQPVQHRH